MLYMQIIIVKVIKKKKVNIIKIKFLMQINVDIFYMQTLFEGV